MNARQRFDDCARGWRVSLRRRVETETSLLGFGERDATPVVLKVAKRRTDEWNAGAVARAFGGRGVVAIHESAPGAMLMERLTPGHALTRMSLDGDDDRATAVIARVVGQMSAPADAGDWPGVHDWGAAFDRYRASGDRQVPGDLVDAGQRWFTTLAASQQTSRLLHGDLHHDNILFDEIRGWVAIDPKGVTGEMEYELGAALRNPIERPDLFASAATIETRVACLARALGINIERTLAWAFAQAILSAIWDVEDGHEVHAASPVLQLARAIEPMLPRRP